MTPVQVEHNMALESSSSCHQGLTPPDSPKTGLALPQTTVKDLKDLFDVLKRVPGDLTNREPPNTPVFQGNFQVDLDMVQLKQLMGKLIYGESASTELSMAAKPSRSSPASNEQEGGISVADESNLKHPISTTPDDFKLSSTPSFKTVVETWDPKACRYEIGEPVETSSSLDDYGEYAFVARERIGRNSEEVTVYIDIKSDGLRDILRTVLQDVKAIGLMEGKPSIEQNVLFHFLSELDRCAENMDNSSDHESALAELHMLIDHLKQAYAAISQRLSSMLQHGHITYDLLWALFKPGCHVCTTCIGTKEPRCVILHVGEEITQNYETWFNLECRCFDDRVKFGKAEISLRVPKFRASKLIASFGAYPLHHHPRHEQARKVLAERGQTFQNLAGSHIQHCTDSTSSTNKGKSAKPPCKDRHYLDLNTGAMVSLRCDVHSASHKPLSSFGSDQLLKLDSGSMETSPTSGSPCSFLKVLAFEEIQYFDLDAGKMNTKSVALAH